MTGIFGRPSSGYVNVPLLAGEQVVREQVASILSRGGTPIMGGQLVLTDQRLLFRPLALGAANQLIQLGLNLIGGLAIIASIVDTIVKNADGSAGAIPTDQITSVAVGGRTRGSLAHPPTLVINMTSGNVVEFGINASIGTPNWSPKNVTARDSMIQDIKNYLG